MRLRLPEVCTIQMGFTPRGHGGLGSTRIVRVGVDSPGAGLGGSDFRGLPVIQMRDVPDSLVMRMDSFAPAAPETPAFSAPRPARYLVRGGDVLFRSRGDRATAAVIDPDFTGALPAALPLVILRPDPAFVTGPYLAWAVNSFGAQRHFDRAAQGGNMRMIPRASLNDLKIDIPPLTFQNCITNADMLSVEEEHLAVRLAAQRRLHMRLTLEAAAERNTQ